MLLKGLETIEESELDRIGDLEHILMTLKARARQQLDQDDDGARLQRACRSA